MWQVTAGDKPPRYIDCVSGSRDSRLTSFRVALVRGLAHPSPRFRLPPERLSSGFWVHTLTPYRGTGQARKSSPIRGRGGGPAQGAREGRTYGDRGNRWAGGWAFAVDPNPRAPTRDAPTGTVGVCWEAGVTAAGGIHPHLNPLPSRERKMTGCRLGTWVTLSWVRRMTLVVVSADTVTTPL